jgi:hypothetical protein
MCPSPFEITKVGIQTALLTNVYLTGELLSTCWFCEPLRVVS